MPVDHEHSAWTKVLDTYVREGVVDYAGLKATGAAALDGYLASLSATCASDYKGWTQQQQLAFWINAYNAFTVRLVLDHHPIDSIRSIGLLRGSAFRQVFIPFEALRGRRLSLNDIEHEILRKEFSEPRIHFALVCASKGCPPLGRHAFTASALERQLDSATRAFIADAGKNRFDASSATLSLSSIFKWFRGDFEKSAGSIPEFVARHSDEATARAIRGAEEVKVRFLEYDWSLNGR